MGAHLATLRVGNLEGVCLAGRTDGRTTGADFKPDILDLKVFTHSKKKLPNNVETARGVQMAPKSGSERI